jgi:hypothetical protein
MKRNSIYAIAWCIFIIVLIFHREIGFVSGFLLLIIISFLFEKDKLWVWIPAIIISWIWVYIARDIYSGYNTFNLSIMNISLFPVIIWPTGLVFGYYFLFPKVRGRNWMIKWVKMFIIYSFALIMFESIGYNLFGICLDYGKSNMYHGWPVLNCFHSPQWMQFGYFLNGLVFYGVASFFSERKQ